MTWGLVTGLMWGGVAAVFIFVVAEFSRAAAQLFCCSNNHAKSKFSSLPYCAIWF